MSDVNPILVPVMEKLNDALNRLARIESLLSSTPTQQTADSKKLIPLAEAMSKFNVSRTTIDRKCRAGLFDKFSMPGSSKVYLDENQIVNFFKFKGHGKNIS